MQVQDSIGAGFYSQIKPYQENPYPHTDGPSPRELRHQGPDHDDDVKPDDCETCGSQLASVLRELHVGGWFKTLHVAAWRWFWHISWQILGLSLPLVRLIEFDPCGLLLFFYFSLYLPPLFPLHLSKGNLRKQSASYNLRH